MTRWARTSRASPPRFRARRTKCRISPASNHLALCLPHRAEAGPLVNPGLEPEEAFLAGRNKNSKSSIQKAAPAAAAEYPVLAVAVHELHYPVRVALHTLHSLTPRKKFVFRIYPTLGGSLPLTSAETDVTLHQAREKGTP